MFNEKAKCVDCGREFIKRSVQQTRCYDCQVERRKELEHKRYMDKKRRLHNEKKKMILNGAVYHNGHPQVCEVLDKCYYGSQTKNGCSYILETGQSRIKNGLWIENGKCPAFIESDKKRRKRQEIPTYTRPGVEGEFSFKNFAEV